MKKYKKIILTGIALNSLMLTSCFGQNKEDLEEHINWSLDSTYGSGTYYKPEITKNEFIIATAECYFIFDDNNKQSLPVNWTSNNEYVSLQYVSNKKSGRALFGGSFVNDPYYLAKVNSFPESDKEISFSLDFSYKGIDIKREYIAVLKSQDDQFIAQQMRGWKKKGNILEYYSKFESDVVKDGQLYTDYMKQAKWNLDTNIVTASSLSKTGIGGSTQLWVSGDYKYRYDVYDQVLSCDGIGDLDISRTYPSSEYETKGKKWENPLDDFSSMLIGINKYLKHNGQSEMCSVPEAEKSTKALFNVK